MPLEKISMFVDALVEVKKIVGKLETGAIRN